jgi:hypothetical protein
MRRVMQLLEAAQEDRLAIPLVDVSEAVQERG